MVSRRYPAPRTPRASRIMIDVREPLPAPAPRGGYAPGDVGVDDWRWRDRAVADLESLVAGSVPGHHGGSPSEVDSDPLGQALERLRADDNIGGAVERIVDALTEPHVAAAVLALEGAGKLGSLIVQERRRRGREELEAAVLDPTSDVAELQRIIKAQSWVFGGRYVEPRPDHPVPGLDRIAVPLRRTDGAMHVVEVGPANVPQLVHRDGSGLVVGDAVVHAVNRAIVQLEALDRLHDGIVEAFDGWDTRRAFATVVIGHSGYTAIGYRDLRATLRTYSSHLAGVEVISYDELLEAAEHALAFDEPPDALAG
jgi:hypothetical protein